MRRFKMSCLLIGEIVAFLNSDIKFFTAVDYCGSSKDFLRIVGDRSLSKPGYFLSCLVCFYWVNTCPHFTFRGWQFAMSSGCVMCVEFKHTNAMSYSWHICELRLSPLMTFSLTVFFRHRQGMRSELLLECCIFHSTVFCPGGPNRV